MENRTAERRDDSNALPPASVTSSLRKSVSVDSFAQYNRESPVLPGPRPNRGNTSSALEPPRNIMYDVPSTLRREQEGQLQAIHNSGWNGSSSKASNEPTLHDSDVERSDTLGSPVERYRHTSLRPQDHTKPSLRGGELPLPSRTPTLSTASSLSSVVSDLTTNSSTLEDVPRSLSSTSLQLPRRGTLPSVIPRGRTRSGSLGVYGSNSVKRPTTSSYVFDVRNVDPTVTLIVVGTPGCGKSIVIRKGLKKFALSEPIACRTISGIPGLTSVTHYIRRTGRVGQLENIIDCPLKVLEANVMLLSTFQRPSSSRNSPILDPVSRVDGVVICYDASSPLSFAPVEKILSDYSSMRVPILALVCKSDLPHRVDSAKAHSLCKQYDVGLIEVNHEIGKDRIGLAFEFLLQAVWRDRRDKRQGADVKYWNPASPRLLRHSSLWHTSRSATPVASSPMITVNIASSDQNSGVSGGLNSQASASSYSPTVTISLNDPRNPGDPHSITWKRGHGLPTLKPRGNSEKHVTKDNANANVHSTSVEKTEVKEKDLKPTLYMNIEELLDKLLFLAVSADDPAFITHFLLTYRRFTTPRSVLLAMQKRIRQLDSSSGDPMFACFAQMRICALLEAWIRDYPHDFSVRGTAGALSALIKSILSKTYLLHYGSELLPFLETLPGLKDDDAAWALKVDDIRGDSDTESFLDDDEVMKSLETDSIASSVHMFSQEKAQQIAPLRERKGSLPLAKALMQVAGSVVNGHSSESVEASVKYKLKELVKLAHEVMMLDPNAIAQEITRLQTNLLLNIQPRHWLHLTYVGKNEASESISALVSFSNHLAEWVLSLILCHDKPRNRARQVEKCVEIAAKLRQLNNYSALRAFIAGIHGSTFAGDETMETFRIKSPEHYKSLQKWELLFRPLRSHRAYRMALRNSKGGCVPALEVHIQDLIRAHEGNSDTHVNDASKIHWGKFNLIGKFIISTTHCQIQCRSAEEYHFPDRGDSIERLIRQSLMAEELKRMRLPPEYAGPEEGVPFQSTQIAPPLPTPQHNPLQPRPSQPQTAPHRLFSSHPPLHSKAPEITALQTPSHQTIAIQLTQPRPVPQGPMAQAKLAESSQTQNKDLQAMHKLLYW